MNMQHNEGKIIEKFKEIKYQDGLILIEHIINNYDEDLIKGIIGSLSKNKNKHTYEIYDYIIKNTDINYNTFIIYEMYCFIHLCASNRNIDLLNYLIKKKDVDINIKNNDGNEETALMYASMYSTKGLPIEIIKILLDNNADPNLQNRFGETALMYAIESSNMVSSNRISTIKVIKLLLENGADINLQNIYGHTAYDLAKTEECKKLIKSYMN